MKNSILGIAIILFLGQIFLATSANKSFPDPDMQAIMNKNTNYSGTNTQAAKITFQAKGNEPIKGYLFSGETSNILTLTAIIGGSASSQVPSDGDNWGSSYTFNSGTVAAGTPVQFHLHASIPSMDYYNDQKSTDNLYHVMAKGFSGYDKTGADIPHGIWMGWEDNDPTISHVGSDYDFNDLCFIVQGVTEYATDIDGHTVMVNPPPATMGARIVGWREENTF